MSCSLSHDQQLARPAGQRQRRRERQPLRAGRRSCAAVWTTGAAPRAARGRRSPARWGSATKACCAPEPAYTTAQRSGRIDRQPVERIGQRVRDRSRCGAGVGRRAFDDGQRRLLVGLVVAELRAVAGRQHVQLAAVGRGAAFRMSRPVAIGARCAGSGRRPALSSTTRSRGRVHDRDDRRVRPKLASAARRRLTRPPGGRRSPGATAIASAARQCGDRGRWSSRFLHGWLQSTTRAPSSKPVSVRASPLSRVTKVMRPSGCFCAT